MSKGLGLAGFRASRCWPCVPDRFAQGRRQDDRLAHKCGEESEIC